MIALLVIGNGRLEMLNQAVDAALSHLPPMDHLLMVDDSGDRGVARDLARTYPDFTIESHVTNLGMARAVQAGFDLVHDTDAEFVFWLEEDMVLTAAPPVDDAIAVLETHPRVAQMYFRRGPQHPLEIECGCVLEAMCVQASESRVHERWTEQTHIFAMGPCLIPRRVLEVGWPAGPIGVGNEAGMTDRLAAKGFRFGAWGTPGDGQVWHDHIGYGARGAAWQL